MISTGPAKKRRKLSGDFLVPEELSDRSGHISQNSQNRIVASILATLNHLTYMTPLIY